MSDRSFDKKKLKTNFIASNDIANSISARNIHIFRHRILNPVLPLDLSLQKYIKDKSDTWSNNVKSDITYATDNMSSIKENVANFFSALVDIKADSDELKEFQFNNEAEKQNKTNELICELEKNFNINKQAVWSIEKAIELREVIRKFTEKINKIVEAVDRSSNL